MFPQIRACGENYRKQISPGALTPGFSSENDKRLSGTGEVFRKTISVCEYIFQTLLNLVMGRFAFGGI